jgi:hypothetical protein
MRAISSLAQRTSETFSEHEVIGVRPDEMSEVSLQVRDDVLRHGNTPPPSVGLRRANHDGIVPECVHGPLDPYRRVQQVEVPSTKAEQLRPAQPTPGSKQDKGT